MQSTQTLSSQIKGHDYFSCHRSRMEVNNSYFVSIAKELTAIGCDVFTPSSDKLISFIKVEKDGKHIFFGFTDVPYTWYLQCNINYKQGNGSGKTIAERHDYDIPYTASEILIAMQPNCPTIGGDSHLQKFIN